MLGHTDKATINKRRPLTPNMQRVLKSLIEAGRSKHRELSQSDANACRALCDRGYATWHVEDYSYSATDEGHAVVNREKDNRT